METKDIFSKISDMQHFAAENNIDLYFFRKFEKNGLKCKPYALSLAVENQDVDEQLLNEYSKQLESLVGCKTKIFKKEDLQTLWSMYEKKNLILPLSNASEETFNRLYPSNFFFKQRPEDEDLSIENIQIDNADESDSLSSENAIKTITDILDDLTEADRNKALEEVNSRYPSSVQMNQY